MKVAVLTLGCKVNKYESDALVFELEKRGYSSTDKLEWADAYIINTCAVTNEAEKKSRQMLERARKFNKDAKIFVIGCASQNRPSQFEKHGVQFLMGTANKKEILDRLQEFGQTLSPLPAKYEDDLFSKQTNERAYIKIQDGCNKFCSYCIIPYLRGRSRSRELKSIIDEVKKLPQNVQEIVLVGIDVADFKIEDKLALGTLLKELDGFNKRLRLSSMEDNLINENFLEELASVKNFCPHFHLSLQSGCDEVLKKMNRHYTTSDFEKSVNLIRKYFPLAGITTDIIVGFPTETEENFEETLNFAKKVKFSQLHIFPYSERSGTAASKLYKDISKQIKTSRLKRLEEVGKNLQRDFINQNKTLSVLIEEKHGEWFEGYSKNYIKCKIAYNKNLKIGQIASVKIIENKGTFAICEVL